MKCSAAFLVLSWVVLLKNITFFSDQHQLDQMQMDQKLDQQQLDQLQKEQLDKRSLKDKFAQRRFN
uniref:Uncharacterized protein n=1 Tax=Xiphophorus maculatus TaxID=8083 RepID=A0A3B5Q369_XIPMA